MSAPKFYYYVALMNAAQSKMRLIKGPFASKADADAAIPEVRADIAANIPELAAVTLHVFPSTVDHGPGDIDRIDAMLEAMCEAGFLKV